MQFKGRFGYDPTWADAAGHCTEKIKAAWKRALCAKGLEWTEPTDREPIDQPCRVSAGK